jgi:hypothetical protein
MIELLQFVFQDLTHFIGFCILLILALLGVDRVLWQLASIVRAARKN